jgi:hypothetical protein
MGIFGFLTGDKSDGGLTSKEVEVGKDYKYLAEYADRRYKGYTNCRTLKRKAEDKSKGAKKHDYNMMFDAGRRKRALFFVRTDTRRAKDDHDIIGRKDDHRLRRVLHALKPGFSVKL